MTDAYREYVASQLAQYEKVVVHAPDRRGRTRPTTRYRKVRDGWGPAEALADARRRDSEEIADDIFTCSVVMARLCSDEKARAMPEHALLHMASGIVGCVGARMLSATARSLGISDDRARMLVEQLDAADRQREGMVGSG